MSFRTKFALILASASLALYTLVGGLLATRAQQPANDPNAQLRIFESVLQHIQNDYVDEPNMEKVRLGALRGLAGGLDPYSSFLTADQVKSYEANKTSNKTGIGAEFSQISGYLYIISAIKGSPAEKAGLRSGDFIEYIDNKATRDISLYDARQLINGDAGSGVTLRVLRVGEKPQTIKVVRGSFKVPTAESRIEAGRIGVVKVYSLDEGEGNDVRTQVASLAKQGVQKIVLDLRGVAGGSLTEGVAVANLFIKNGDIAKIIGRENKVLNTYSAEPSKTVFEGNVAVLINLGTAGAAEIVASAVLAQKRGEVIGERSFGAGTEQKLFQLSSGGGYLLTVAKWASPNGTPFLGEDRATTGIKPSVEVKRPDTPEPLEVDGLIDQQDNNNPQTQTTPAPKPMPKAVEDIQMKKALEILGEKAVAGKAGASE